MKIKNNGKVHPSPSSSSSSSSTATTTTSSSDPIVSTLQLLPASVLALASILPPPDLDVLSYLLSRSLHLSSSSSSPSDRKSSSVSPLSSSVAHRPPSFECDCFDCYTIYWLRWDSSPNRDLIHHVIDAFEDHLSSASSSSSSSTVPFVGKAEVGGGGRRSKDKGINREKRERMDTSSQESRGNGGVLDGGGEAGPREKRGDEENDAVAIDDSSPGSSLPRPPPTPSPGVALSAASRGGGGGEHKGLARKVLPDVLGILISRLWNLWSPNV